MGKQSELIITKGQEFKIVVKDSIKEDDVFIDQYEQAAGMLNTIVAGINCSRREGRKVC